jgi:multicomponent Na+:H+ antiporter subunit D
LGLGLGFVSVAAAVMVAAMGLYSRALAERAGAVAAPGSRGFAALRRLHAGHIGDYVSWLMTGIAALAALVGIPLAR